MIYLDHAATSFPKPGMVIDAVVHAMQTAGNSARGTYPSALDASRILYNTREKLSLLFGCKRPDHVIFAPSSTVALNMAINGLFSPGDHVITTDLEHNSVLRPLYRMESLGMELDFVPADRAGSPNYDAFERLIRSNTKGIVCTHASNLTGNMVDLFKIGEIARRHHLLFIVDASQTAGFIPVNMEFMQIDVLCFTGHKSLMGPQGTGGLCIKYGVDIRPWAVGGTGTDSYNHFQPSALPDRLEAGTQNVHGIAGLSAAVDFINETGMDVIREKELFLMRRFYEGISVLDGITVYGDFSSFNRVPIVALNIRDVDSSAVSDELSEVYGIAVRSGVHCAPRMHTALGTQKQGAVRFSFGWFNTADEIDAAIDAVGRMSEK